MEPFVLERPEHSISRRDIDRDVLKVLYRLINANHVAYLVGGGVRDLMLGRRPKDFDIATSAHPHEVRALFRNSRLVGRRFRLAHVFFGPTNIEVATFRRRGEHDDLNEPLIRQDNTFGTAEEDAFRRDFTVNALFYDPASFRVIDYVGGIRDLGERMIRTVGEPQLRMREDPVRMIRAVRLAAKLDFEIEPATACAIERCAGELIKASAPRLVEEIYRTLLLADSARALLLMERLGLLDYLLPMLSQHLKQQHHGLEAAPTIRVMGALGEAIRRGFEPPRGFLLACLLADMHLASAMPGSSHAAGLCDALRARGFSRADTEHLRLLLDALGHMLKPSRITRRLVRRPYFSLVRDLLDLIAPVCSIDTRDLERFLSVPANHNRNTGGNPSSGPMGHGTRSWRGRRRRGRRRSHARSLRLEQIGASNPDAVHGQACRENLPTESPIQTRPRSNSIPDS